MKNERLENVKTHAKALVDIRPMLTDMSPLIVSHPFTNSGYIGIINNKGEHVLADITKEEDFLLWQASMTKMIDSANDIEQIFNLINTPYLLYFMDCIKANLTPKEFGEFLKEAWISTEFPNNNPNTSKKEALALFKAADKRYLMSEEEQDIYNKMKDTITIYRGVSKGSKKEILGMSWSTSPSIAKKFSNRFSRAGKVFKAEIDKEHIFAFFNSRHEAETVVDYNHLKNIQPFNDPEEELGEE